MKNFEELSWEAQQIFYVCQNTKMLRQKTEALIKCLQKKANKGIELFKDQLVNSSVMSQFCRLGIKELIKNEFDNNFTKEQKKEFKEYYSEYILNEIEY